MTIGLVPLDVAALLMQALLLYAIRVAHLGSPDSPVGQMRQGCVALALSSAAGLAALGPAALLGPVPAFATGLVLIALLATAETVEYIALLYFNDSAVKVYPHLPVALDNRSALKSVRAYAAQYFPVRYLGLVLGVMAPTLVVLSIGTGDGMRVTVPVGLGLASWAMLRFGPRDTVPQEATPAEKLFLMADDETIRPEPLYISIRTDTAIPREPARPVPRTVLVVLLESAGGGVTAARDASTALAERIRVRAGDPERWFLPANVVTNSSCTDISIPSLVTGSGPHEGIGKLHRMPLLFDLAKARGFATAFLSSSTLRWGRFDAFFAGTQVDRRVTAETTGLPFINDLTVDDHAVAGEAARWIAEQSGGALAVLYLNALHVPFQSTSECGIPDDITIRRDRAAYVVETSLALLFRTLRETGRYEDACIFVVGDHGETYGYDGSDEGGRMARTIKLTADVLHPLFLMKPPRDLPAAMSEALARNAHALVANVDLAPSIADLLEVAPAGGLEYSGYSLFRDIPADRVAYTLNINDWRSWNKGAVAISRERRHVFVDYQSDRLCWNVGRDATGERTGEEPANGDLLALAFREQIVRASISTVFREKLGAT